MVYLNNTITWRGPHWVLSCAYCMASGCFALGDSVYIPHLGLLIALGCSRCYHQEQQPQSNARLLGVVAVQSARSASFTPCWRMACGLGAGAVSDQFCRTTAAGVHRERLPRWGDETTLLVPPTTRLDGSTRGPPPWTADQWQTSRVVLELAGE